MIQVIRQDVLGRMIIIISLFIAREIDPARPISKFSPYSRPSDRANLSLPRWASASFT